MAHEISRETFDRLKADPSQEAATLRKDYQRAVKCNEQVVIDEPDGSKSLVECDCNGEFVTHPMKPR